MARRGDDDDDAPWLAGVAEERGRTTSVSRRSFWLGVTLFLVALAAILGGLYAVTSRPREEGSARVTVDPEQLPLIAADAGPYKVRPLDPGGLQVDGAGDAMHAAATGADPGGEIDPYAVPEEPVTRPGEAEPQELLPPGDGASARAAIPPLGVVPRVTPPALPPPSRIPVAPVVATAPPKSPPVTTAKPTPTPASTPVVSAKLDPAKPSTTARAETGKDVPATPSTGGPSALQLGAFSSRDKAESAWTAAKDRFPAVAGLTKRIDAIDRNGAKLYRLRASGVANRAAAADLCARLRVAGAACLVAE